MNTERDRRDPDIYSGELTHDADLGPQTDEDTAETAEATPEGERNE